MTVYRLRIGSGALWPTNEPAGLSAVVYRPFSTKASTDGDRGTGDFPSKTGGSEGWDGSEYDDANFTIATDATAPVSPSSVGRITYPVGLAANTEPAVVQTQSFAASTLSEMYVLAFLRLGPTYWVGSTRNKLYFHRTDRETSRPEPFLALNDNGDGTFTLAVNFQGTPDNGAGFFDATGIGAEMEADTWYQIETYLVLNSANEVADGIFRCWVNGTLVIERTDVEYRNDTDPLYWSTLHVAPTFGGSSGAANDTEFYFDLDHIYVKGA